MERVISSNYNRFNAKEAWTQNLQQAIFASDKIRSTIGPTGAYKLVTYNRGPEQVVKVTKDSIAILDELAINYPPAIIVAESAKMQRNEIGDGAACFVVFLSALLKQADTLSAMGLHPNTIVEGYSLAAKKATEIMEMQSKSIGCDGDVLDSIDCGRNLLTPKLRLMIRRAYTRSFSNGSFDIDNVGFIKKIGCCAQESTLIDGIIIRKDKAHPNMPNHVKDLRVAVTSGHLGINRLELKMRREGPIPIQVNITNHQQIQQLNQVTEKLENSYLKVLVKHKINVLVSAQPIEERQKTALVMNGIFAIESVTKNDLEGIARATGAKVLALISDLSKDDVGKAEALSVDKLDLEKTVTFQGCGGATFLLRANTRCILDELEVAIKNSLITLKLSDKEPKFLPGAGAVEIMIAQELHRYALTIPNRHQLAIEAFAEALIDIPRCLAENYGLNSTEILIKLRQLHDSGLASYGVGVQGCTEGVCTQSIAVLRSIVRRAYEVSSLMLHIDELLISKEIAKFHKK